MIVVYHAWIEGYTWLKLCGSQIVCSNGLTCDVFVYKQAHFMARL